MPHKRSMLGAKRRLVRRVLLSRAFIDRQMGEVVNTLTAEQLAGILGTSTDHLASEIIRGEVLADTRGRGSLQQRG